MSELVVHIPLDWRGVHTSLWSWALGSRSPDMNLTLDHKLRRGAGLLQRWTTVYDLACKIRY